MQDNNQTKHINSGRPYVVAPAYNRRLAKVAVYFSAGHFSGY